MSVRTSPLGTTTLPPTPLKTFRRSPSSGLWLSLSIAAVVFVIAYDDGGYGLASRSIAAISLWWAIILCFGLGLLPLVPSRKPAFVSGGLLAGFAVWTLASTSWAPSAENAFNEFNRVSLYLSLFVLAVAVGTRYNAGRWAEGLALGIVTTGFVSLASRLFPHLFSMRGVAAFLPSA